MKKIFIKRYKSDSNAKRFYTGFKNYDAIKIMMQNYDAEAKNQKLVECIFSKAQTNVTWR